MYYVKRTYGKNSDFLKAWDKDYGTVCIGSKKLAMSFETEQEAVSASIQASLKCRGFNGSAKPVDMTFSVVAAH